MAGTFSLGGTWKLAWAELHDPDYVTAPRVEGRTLIDARVPGSVHRALLDAGLLEDLNIGLNSLKARWVEEQVWIYRRTFVPPEEALKANAWLVFDRLELGATVWLNGQEIGRHANAHRPARFPVTGRLVKGENILVVRLVSGLYLNIDKPICEYDGTLSGRLTRRVWNRSPQHQHGWDWHPRLINVGILGDVRLEWCAGPALVQLAVFAVPSPDLSQAALHVRAVVENPGEKTSAVLRARVDRVGAELASACDIPPGESRHELVLRLEKPGLWWPRGHGAQHLYTVEATLECKGELQRARRRTGIRRVEVDQSPHPEEGTYFILKINNRPVFCKGGNWVPADLLYGDVTAERYNRLVELALGANFNTLRVWGGGLFADHALLDACDEHGVLIWHDFLFACGKYPGDWPEFAAEVRREMTYAVRELAHHPSVVVWCGNNEIEWGDWEWGYDSALRTHPHYAIFHHDIPKIVRAENPSVFYWPSSPFSPDQRPPNDPTVGDQHPWRVSIGEPGASDWWLYRTHKDRFPNEGGVLGASSLATLRQFLPERERYVLSPSWEHHDNPFAFMDASRGELGRAYKTVRLWTGLDPLSMDWQDYAFASALMQAEGLQEYIANYRRRMFSTASAIFWMYNDSWPVTHGWSIVDYYLRKKLAYHPVRRAFRPVTVVVAEESGEVVVFGVNDTPQDWSGKLRWGLFLLAGGRPVDELLSVTIPANSSVPLARIGRAEWQELGFTKSGAFAVLYEGGRPVAQHRLFLERFKDLELVTSPGLKLELAGGKLEVSSEQFVWAVCLDVDGELELSDNCFDVLPGLPYVVDWNDTLGEPKVVRIGSRDIVRPRA